MFELILFLVFILPMVVAGSAIIGFTIRWIIRSM